MRAHCLKYIRIKSFLNKISGSPLSLLGHFPNYEWRGPVLLSFFLLRAAVVNCSGLGSLHCYFYLLLSYLGEKRKNKVLKNVVVNCLGHGSPHCYLVVYKIQLKREKNCFAT